ncbi:MAG: SDR family oxidoreductase [Gemmatales bacterium]|nr:SDR family oxidoreductase [Gemmatales bacterium]MDW8388066.1 SDR family oxidoreductase [Gemmatales bacterium]
MSKRIVITGATRGLGKALVARFAEMGHIVIGCGRSRQRVEELTRQYGPPHAFAVVDVADDAAVARWAEAVLASHGPPDLLINNAALMNRLDKLWNLSADDFDPVIDVNIKGVANVIRHFVPAMVKRRQGVIVNLSSGWGRSTAPEVAPYCATKFAIEGLTKAMAQELPSGMAAIPLNPGIIDTDMLRECWAEGASRYPKPEAWAVKAAPFLLQLGAKDNGKSLSVPL